MMNYDEIRKNYKESINDNIGLLEIIKEDSDLTMDQIIEIAKLTNYCEIVLLLTEIKNEIASIRTAKNRDKK